MKSLRSTKFSRLKRFAQIAAILAAASLAAVSCRPGRRDTFVVGSKNFTEQAILGESVAQQLEAKTHLHVVRRFYLSGKPTFASKRCWQAASMRNVEYTGTALTAILKEAPLKRPRIGLSAGERRIREAFSL